MPSVHRIVLANRRRQPCISPDHLVGVGCLWLAQGLVALVGREVDHRVVRRGVGRVYNQLVGGKQRWGADRSNSKPNAPRGRRCARPALATGNAVERVSTSSPTQRHKRHELLWQSMQVMSRGKATMRRRPRRVEELCRPWHARPPRWSACRRDRPRRRAAHPRTLQGR